MIKKISLTFVFSIFLIVDFGFAQDILLVPQKSIDSLQQLIKISDNDEEKVRLLNEYARLNFYNLEYKTGLIAAVEAHELSSEINFLGGEIMFHITAATFLGQGDLQSYHLMQGRVLAVQNNEEDLYVVPGYPKGYPPARDNELIERLLSVLLYFEESGNKEIQGIILNQLGFSYYFMGGHEKLQSIHNRTIKLYTDLNQLYPLLIFYNYKMFSINQGLYEADKNQVINEFEEALTRTTDKNQLTPFYHQLANFYTKLGQWAIAIDYYLKSVEHFKSTNDLTMLNEVYNGMSQMYESLEMYEKQAEIVEKQIRLIEQLNHPENLSGFYRRSAWTMLVTKRYDKARAYMEKALQTAKPNMIEILKASKNSLEGQILMDDKRYKEAMPFIKKSYSFFSTNDAPFGRGTTPWEAMRLAECYYQTRDLDEALRFGQMAHRHEAKSGLFNVRLKRKINLVLYEVYIAREEKLQALKHLQYHHDLVEKAKINDNANLLVQAEVSSVLEKSQMEIIKLEQEQILKEQQNKTQRLWIFSIAGALLSAIILALVLYRNNKNKQKANTTLKEQKEEIESTLEKLEATQSQLIQSEKMASLGELTAGIAHEIQNPLNFVNNFSDVSIDLIDEMQEELNLGNPDVAREISDDVKQNLDKIHHHGDRASSIVKGMLEHSRTGDGEKAPTDINGLTDEYLRLSYHGLRAKDKSFNAEFKLDFDETLPKVSVVPQDIGRVLLNLINNAFYAVDKKAKSGVLGYRPEIIVSTKMHKKSMEIKISDNGDGIPEQVRKKIFQPFFTTKPTGQGTGLGLSLSYDIITKGHDGHLEVETEEGAGSRFVIILPVV